MGECIPAMTMLKSNVVSQVIQTAVFTRDQLNIKILKAVARNRTRMLREVEDVKEELAEKRSHLFRL
jgi:hypothetical protein